MSWPFARRRGYVGSAATVLAALGALLSGACTDEFADARPQWTIYVATDAPVPQFGDRLLVELLDAEGQLACSGCRRQFGIGQPDDWPISYGVLPPEAGGEPRIRVRLYRAIDAGADGLPGSDRVIDALGSLPPARDGVVRVGVVLGMDCFGVAADVEGRLTCDPGAGELVAEPVLPTLLEGPPLPTVGSWPLAQPVACPAPAPLGMVCVPGGAFLLGSPIRTLTEGQRQPRPERLTVLSPFALDAEEVTVGLVRGLVRTGGVTEPVRQHADPAEWSYECNYLGPDEPANDALPVNCVVFDQAAQICALLGKRLPTEAEWEYAAGNTGDESTFPWGASEDVCHHAIVARGRQEITGHAITTCRVLDGQTLDWGPVAGGHEGDVTELGIRNLGGNVTEWIADAYAAYDEACWSPESRILFDPRCEHSEGAHHVQRGGSWANYPMVAKVFTRGGSVTGGPSSGVGLRCALSL